MVTARDVRRIALALPETSEDPDHFAFAVQNRGKRKGIAWAWKERLAPKQPRVPRNDILAVRVADETVKAALLSSDPDKFFTEPHYNGFPAILVRLEAVSTAELAELLLEAWRCQAPRALVKEHDEAAQQRSRPGRRVRRPKAVVQGPRSERSG